MQNEIKQEPRSPSPAKEDMGIVQNETAIPQQQPAVCYCGAPRILGELEVCCSGCERWFHHKCFRNLEDFGGLPFMVSYNFQCQNCSPDGTEKICVSSTDHSSMTVMALANMTLDYRNEPGKSADMKVSNPFFDVETQIADYMDKNWKFLSTQARPKNTRNWHRTILEILQKETELFVQHPERETAFALKERDLFRIGPMHESVVQLFKRNRSIGEQQLNNSSASGLVSRGRGRPPKTHGTSKSKQKTAAANLNLVISKQSNESSSKASTTSRALGRMLANHGNMRIEEQMGKREQLDGRQTHGEHSTSTSKANVEKMPAKESSNKIKVETEAEMRAKEPESSAATPNMEIVSKAELVELRRCKRRFEEMQPEFQSNKRRLEEMEVEKKNDEKKLEQFEALKGFMAAGLQIRLEEPKRATIPLTLPDFTNLAAHQNGFEISSDCMELAGFKWSFGAHRFAKGAWMQLFLSAISPAHYKGQFELDMDISFRLLNTAALSKEIREEMADIKVKNTQILELKQGKSTIRFDLDSMGGAGIAEFAEIEKLMDPKNGFLRNGSIQLEVVFLVKAVKLDRFLLADD